VQKKNRGEKRAQVKSREKGGEKNECDPGGSGLCEQNGGERAGHEGAHHGQRNGKPRTPPYYELF
jgi:hypothetical protein